MRGRGAKAIPPSVLSRSNSGGLEGGGDKEGGGGASCSLRYRPTNIEEALQNYPPFPTVISFVVDNYNVKSVEMIQDIKKSFRSSPYFISLPSSLTSTKSSAIKNDIERYSDRYIKKSSKDFDKNRISSIQTDLSCIPSELYETRKVSNSFVGAASSTPTKRMLSETRKKSILENLEKKISLDEDGDLEGEEDEKDEDENDLEEQEDEDDLEDDTDYNMSYFENGDDYGDADDGDDGPVY